MTPQTPATPTHASELDEGRSEPRRLSLSGRNRGLAVGLAAGVIGTTLVGGGLALAASPHTTAKASPGATSSTGAAATSGAAKHGKMRHGLGGALGRVVHGEGVVKTKTGYETVDVARGTFTVTGTTVTVKSADGVVSPAYTLGTATHVRADKKKATTSAVTTGATGEIVGVKSATGLDAKLVIVT